MFSVCCSKRHQAPQAGRLAPLELLPQKPHPTSQHQVATTLNPVWEHLCFTCAHSLYVLSSIMCPRVPAWLYAALAYERLPRVLCFQRVGKPGSRHCRWICPFHSPDPQSGHDITFSHFVVYPAFNPGVNFPLFHKYAFT